MSDPILNLLFTQYLEIRGKDAFEKFPDETPSTTPSNEMRLYYTDVPATWHRHILNYEGGYVNHPADKGGETNLGITIGTLNKAKARGLVPSHISIKDLSKHPEYVYTIYNVMYYKDCLCDKIPAMLSFAFHDSCVNHGRGGKTAKGTPIGAGMLLQDLLINKYKKNITFDGVVGAKSIEALNEVLQTNSSEKLTKEFNDRRELYFKRIVENNPSQQVFINGWLNRLKKVRTMCEGRVV